MVQPYIIPDNAPVVQLHKAYYPAASWAPKAPQMRKGDKGNPDYKTVEAANKGIIGRLDDNVVMLDCDSQNDSDAMVRVLKALGILDVVPVMVTDRGRHFYFYNDGSIRNNKTAQRLACGIVADIKVGVSNGFDCIAPHGRKPRTILNDLSEELSAELADDDPPGACGPAGMLIPLPDVLAPIPFGESMAGLPAGSRNDTLMKEMGLLKRAGLAYESARTVLDVMNTCVFSMPLPRREFDTVTRIELYNGAYDGKARRSGITVDDLLDDAERALADDEMDIVGDDVDPDELPDTTFMDEPEAPAVNNLRLGLNRDRRMLFDHSAMAATLVKDRRIICVGERLMYFDNGIYVQADSYTLERFVDELKPDSSIRQRKEVTAKIRLLAPVRDVRDADQYLEYYVFENGTFRINLDAGIMEPVDPDPERLIFNRITTEYDKDARDPDLDKFLSDIACGDEFILTQIAEMVGMTLLRRNFIRAIYMLLGNRRNGKSTLLDLIIYTLGQENVSNLKLHAISSRFSTWQLAYKLANIGDDISHEFISDTNTLKSIATSDPIVVERKGQDCYTIIPYSTMIFSVNERPQLHDTTNAALDRINIIPFNAYFAPDAPGYDPMLITRLRRPAVARALVALAVRALCAVLLRGALTETPMKQQLKREYAILNNPVMLFISQMFPDAETLAEMPVGDSEEIAAGQGQAGAIQALIHKHDGEAADKVSLPPVYNLLELSREEVYALYKSFCTAERLNPLGKTLFNRELLKLIDNLDCRLVQRNNVRTQRYIVKDETRPLVFAAL